MLVVRAYDLLGGVVLKLETHTDCCSTGACGQEDGHEYHHGSSSRVAWEGHGAVVAGLLHQALSELGDEAVAELLATTRVERRSSL